ncbi:MAG: hypothetical protein HY809_03930 [Nitrospirae bacterium]|nr:hypothetical protein [Nitrospirota bacterium]
MKSSRQKRKVRKKGNPWSFILLAAAVFVTASLASYIYLKPKFTFESAFISEIHSRNKSLSEDEEKMPSPELYGNSSGASSEEGFREDAALAAAGSVITEFMRTYEVELLDLYMDRSGVIYIDLSAGLVRNFQGDVFKEFNVISGLYGKIKESVPGFTAMKILIQGKEAESLAGHIDISRPVGEEIESAGMQ